LCYNQKEVRFNMKIRKAVVPVAGYGTRFLPATKAMPKEMLPVVDKPVIQIVAEELVKAGIEQIILVTGWHKRAIEDHFDHHLELEAELKRRGKGDLLKAVQEISDMAEFVYVRQKQQRGNGDAILCAKDVVGQEPFVVLWGDDFIAARPSRTKQMLKAYQKYQGTIMSGIRTRKKEDTLKYGFAKGEEIAKGVIRADQLIEKPGPKKVPSDLAVVSGFIFPPEIFPALEEKGERLEEGEELVYLDGVNAIKDQIPAYAIEIKGGRYYDCGDKLGYLKTSVDYGLKDPDIKKEFKKYLKSLRIK